MGYMRSWGHPARRRRQAPLSKKSFWRRRVSTESVDAVSFCSHPHCRQTHRHVWKSLPLRCRCEAHELCWSSGYVTQPWVLHQQGAAVRAAGPQVRLKSVVTSLCGAETSEWTLSHYQSFNQPLIWPVYLLYINSSFLCLRLNINVWNQSSAALPFVSLV